MATTTSLKLPDDLKATIAKVALQEGKTAHALMVETLQSGMEDAMARQQFYAVGHAALEDSLCTNTVFAADDVHAYIAARAAGKQTAKPQAVTLDPEQPMSDTRD